MSLLNTAKITSLIASILICNQASAITLCLTGKIVKSLPTYGESFINAAYLAKEQNNSNHPVVIKTYYYDNKPLEPIRIYTQMKHDGCSAIIGFEYLSDLLLVIKTQKDTSIPIFTSYASTNQSEELPKNIFIFMPTYNFLAQKMLGFLQNKFGEMHDVLIITEENRIEMQKYKEAYSELLKDRRIKFDTFDFLEDDSQLDKKLSGVLSHKNYKYVFLLSGTIAAAKIADRMNSPNTIFIGTENYGSSINQSFYIRLNNKNIHSFFIRNLDFLNASNALNNFQTSYEKRYHSKATLLSAYTYDAANILIRSYDKTGSMSVDSILHNNYHGLTGAHVKNNTFYRSKEFVILSVDKNGYRYEK